MSVSVVSRPESYSAQGNPILYKIQRKDYLVTSTDNSGGLARLSITGDVTADFAVNDVIYVGTIGYMRLSEVISVSLSGGNTKIVTGLQYTGFGGSGYVNNLTFKSLHHISVQFYDGDGFVMFDGLSFRFASDDSGLALVDAQVLRYFVPFFITSNDSLINQSFTGTGISFAGDTGRYKQFYIVYTETWNTGSASPVDDSANKFLSYLAALQIPLPIKMSSKVNSLVDYVIDDVSTKKFCSTLTKFTAWRGFPFYFSTLETLGTIVMSVVLDGVTLATAGTTNTGAAKIGLGIINNSITPNDGVHILELKHGSLVHASAQLEIKTANCTNPIMLVGRDALGGILMWVFEGGNIYETENSDGIKHNLLTVAAPSLTTEEFDAINQAFAPASQIVDSDYSDPSTTFGTQRHENKDVFILSADGVVKTQVVCKQVRAQRNSKAGGNYIEITLELPYTQDI